MLVDIQALHEAVKTVRATTFSGTVKEFYPEKSVMDTYLKTVRVGGIQVLSTDIDIQEPVGSAYE